MNTNLVFFFKTNLILAASKNRRIKISIYNNQPFIIFLKKSETNESGKVIYSFLKNFTNSNSKFKNFKKKQFPLFFFFFNKFLTNFLEFFFNKHILINVKKGSNKFLLRQVSSRKFFYKFFKKNLGVSKRLLGIIYYGLLLKDSTIISNFIKQVVEKLNIKLHKKFFSSLKKLIYDLYKPIFSYLGLLGLLVSIKGKLGVSGSAKKRRYFFHFGQHSITNKTIRFDANHTQIWTFTGTLGFTFLLFF